MRVIHNRVRRLEAKARPRTTRQWTVWARDVAAHELAIADLLEGKAALTDVFVCAFHADKPRTEVRDAGYVIHEPQCQPPAYVWPGSQPAGFFILAPEACQTPEEWEARYREKFQ